MVIAEGCLTVMIRTTGAGPRPALTADSLRPAQLHGSVIGGGCLVTKLFLTLCDPLDCTILINYYNSSFCINIILLCLFYK